jgi:hypothetical protein
MLAVLNECICGAPLTLHVAIKPHNLFGGCRVPWAYQEFAKVYHLRVVRVAPHKVENEYCLLLFRIHPFFHD